MFINNLSNNKNLYFVGLKIMGDVKFSKCWVREAFKKKIAEKETLVHMGERGVKKNPLFLVHQKGDIFLWREGSK